jgi:hypothetical protein
LEREKTGSHIAATMTMTAAGRSSEMTTRTEVEMVSRST